MVLVRYRTRQLLQKASIGALITIFLVAIIIILSTITQETGPPTTSSARTSNVPIAGGINEFINASDCTYVDVSISPTTFLFRKDCVTVELVTSRAKTFSVRKGILNLTEIRPDAHDVLADVLLTYNIKPVLVLINKFEDDIFYARLILKQDDIYLDLDIKPSDALALASRLDTPVYVHKSIIKSQGVRVC